MGYASRDALLGASDIVERDVELSSLGLTVKVRSLPAAYSNQAISEALETIIGPRGEQTARVNTAKLEALQVLHGLVEPHLSSIDDAYTLAQRTGPAWRKMVEAIDAISGIDKDAIEKANATFQPGGPGDPGEVVGDANGTGDGQPDISMPVGP
jgi:hypothetical protein